MKTFLTKPLARSSFALCLLTLALGSYTVLAQSALARSAPGESHTGHTMPTTPDVPVSDLPTTLDPASTLKGVQKIEIATPKYTPGSDILDDYYCYAINPKFKRDAMVTGVQVIPGNRRIVHHAILFRIDAGDRAAVLTKDKASGGKGWPCFGGPGLEEKDGASGSAGGNWLSVWVPGAGDGQFPSGLAQALPKDSLIVMQVHYNFSNETGTDNSKVVLSVAPQGAKLRAIRSQLAAAPVEIRCADNLKTAACRRENTLKENTARIGFLGGNMLPNGLLMSCGQTAAQYQKPVGNAKNIVNSCDQTAPGDNTLFAIAGHMHLLARSIKIELNPGKPGARTLLSIPKWDYRWQGNYWFKTPVKIKKGDVMRTTCTFDNSAENQPMVRGKQQQPKYVLWSEATTEEMCLGILFADAATATVMPTPPRPGAAMPGMPNPGTPMPGMSVPTPPKP